MLKWFTFLITDNENVCARNGTLLPTTADGVPATIYLLTARVSDTTPRVHPQVRTDHGSKKTSSNFLQRFQQIRVDTVRQETSDVFDFWKWHGLTSPASSWAPRSSWLLFRPSPSQHLPRLENSIFLLLTLFLWLHVIFKLFGETLHANDWYSRKKKE